MSSWSHLRQCALQPWSGDWGLLHSMYAHSASSVPGRRLLAQRREMMSKVGVHLPCITVAPPLAVTETRNRCYCVDHISRRLAARHGSPYLPRFEIETEDKGATTGRRHPTWKSLTMILSEAFRPARTFRDRWCVSLPRQWWLCRLHGRKIIPGWWGASNQLNLLGERPIMSQDLPKAASDQDSGR